MHSFNLHLCSTSKIDNTLIGHYMRSFFSAITEYFIIYEKRILEHLNYLRQHNGRAVHDLVMSMVTYSSVFSSLKGSVFEPL